MPMPIPDPLSLTPEQLEFLLAGDASFFPELDAARANPAALRDSPAARVVLQQTEELMPGIAQIPQTRYTHYRFFRRNGDRKHYERAYFGKRTCLGATALRLFLGQEELKDTVQDYLWNLCEETNWVVPAHERGNVIDLFAAETAFLLGQTLTLLGDALDAEVRERVLAEAERRVFVPYLEGHEQHGWYHGPHNWNGVCNSSVAAAFVLLDPNRARAARAVALAFAGLRTFLKRAFEEDGTSTEGTGYWHYGLINFVALSELLRARSEGAIDLLAGEKLRRVAAYPAKMHLCGSHFASFSDCDETVTFNPGILARLALRTDEQSLLGLLAPPARPGGDWRLQMMLRNLLWWDGRVPDAPTLADSYLAAGAVARLVARTPDGAPVVLALKAGHNAEHHNQNDVGSFLLSVGGENLLVDPGRGLYCASYFGAQRYENVFANSYGHSVPRVAGKLQAPGREYAGKILAVETDGPAKRAVAALGGAYPVPGFSLRREWRLGADGTLWVEDTFSGAPGEVEEAFVTWAEVAVDGNTALLRGERRCVRLVVEAPAGARVEVERLEQACRENAKSGVLKRVRFVLPAGEGKARVRVDGV